MAPMGIVETCIAQQSFTWAILPCVSLAAFGLGIRVGRGGGWGQKRGSFLKTPPPHPDWKPGMPQPSPSTEVTPRPVGFISTQDSSGVVNVAPFSYFNAMGHDPPVVAVSICRKGQGQKKDTLNNIEASGEFVASIISEWFVEAANHACGNFPPEVDEMADSGLTPLPSLLVSSPRVKESAFSMECKVRHSYDVKKQDGAVTATVIIAEVVMFHVLPFVLDENGAGEGKPTVSLEALKPISRLGGNSYGRVTSTFDLSRPGRPAGAR